MDLGRKDSNLRIAGPKPVALPLGDAPFRFLFNNNQYYYCIVRHSSITDFIPDNRRIKKENIYRWGNSVILYGILVFNICRSKIKCKFIDHYIEFN